MNEIYETTPLPQLLGSIPEDIGTSPRRDLSGTHTGPSSGFKKRTAVYRVRQTPKAPAAIPATAIPPRTILLSAWRRLRSGAASNAFLNLNLGFFGIEMAIEATFLVVFRVLVHNSIGFWAFLGMTSPFHIAAY